MGCDIHLYTEYFTTIKDVKRWACCDYFKLNPYFGEYEDERKYNHVSIYDGRNYSLFAALANVRNDGYIEPISESRGLPGDVSKVVKEESDFWDGNGHSHSWLTAKELFIYKNKHPVTKHSGMLEPDTLKKFDNCGIPPTHWCEWTNIEGAETREWYVAGSPIDYLVDVVKKKMAEVFYIWDFYDDKKKEEMYWKNADNFRIVFWFDN